MLGEFNRVFNVDELEAHGEEPDDSLTKRNSRNYLDAAADQLLGLGGRSLTGRSQKPQSLAISYSFLVQCYRQKIPTWRMTNWRKKTTELTLQKAVAMQKHPPP